MFFRLFHDTMFFQKHINAWVVGFDFLPTQFTTLRLSGYFSILNSSEIFFYYVVHSKPPTITFTRQE